MTTGTTNIYDGHYYHVFVYILIACHVHCGSCHDRLMCCIVILAMDQHVNVLYIVHTRSRDSARWCSGQDTGLATQRSPLPLDSIYVHPAVLYNKRGQAWEEEALCPREGLSSLAETHPPAVPCARNFRVALLSFDTRRPICILVYCL